MTSHKTPTLELEIIREGENSYKAKAISPKNDKSVESTFPYPLDLLASISEREKLNKRQGSPEEREEIVDEWGKEIFFKVFTGDLLEAYRNLKKEDTYFKVLIKTDVEEMNHLPWEFLHDGKDYIAASGKSSLTRFPLKTKPLVRDAVINGPLKVLAIISNPSDLKEKERLLFEKEEEIILRSLDRATASGRVEVDFEEEASLENIQKRLEEEDYHIIHYSGHGYFNEKEKRGCLIMEGDDGKKREVGAEDLKSLFTPCKELRLLFLSGCQTAVASDVRAFGDLSRSLLRFVPNIISMQFPVYDDAAIKLAEKFYEGIINGKTLDRAMSDARRTLLFQDHAAIKGDFSTPVLFSSDSFAFNIKPSQAQHSVKKKENIFINLQRLGRGFIGRRRELRRIKNAFLRDNKRMVVIHGLGGLGKTVTSTEAADRLSKEFKLLYAFDCSGGGLTAEKVMTDINGLLQHCGVNDFTEILTSPMPLEMKINRLGQELCALPMLLIFDNFEDLLDEDNKNNIADAELKTFFKTLINIATEGTKYIFTSRYNFDITDGRMAQFQEDISLGELNRPEALMVMSKFPVIAKEAFESKLALFDRIGGHPYTIGIFAKHCERKPMEELLKDLKDVANEMVDFTLLDMSYEKLGEKAKELIRKVSIFEKGFPFQAAEWMVGKDVDALEVFGEVSKERIDLIKSEMRKKDEYKNLSDNELKEMIKGALPKIRTAEGLDKMLEEIIHWGLLIKADEEGEESGTLYHVHSLVREFLLKQKIDIKEHKEYLIEGTGFYYESAKDKDEFSSVFLRLEERDLLFKAEEFDEAGNVLLNISEPLIRWGFYRLLDVLFEGTLKTVTGQTLARTLHNFAVTLQERGEYDRAIDKYNESLKIAKELGDKQGIAGSLHQIGYIYFQQGDYDRAVDKYNESMKINEELGNKQGVASTLHQIGIIHQDRGDYDRAVEKYNESMKIKKELGNKQGVASTLHQIGNVYFQQNDYDRAIDKYNESLKIAKELGDKKAIAQTLHQIGIIHQGQGDYDRAVEKYNASMKIAKELGDKQGIASTLHQIGMIHQNQGDYDRAVEKYNESMKIKKELGSKSGIAITLAQLGLSNRKQKKYEEAVKYFVTALAIFEELKSPSCNQVLGDLKKIKEEIGEERFKEIYKQLSINS